MPQRRPTAATPEAHLPQCVYYKGCVNPAQPGWIMCRRHKDADRFFDARDLSSGISPELHEDLPASTAHLVGVPPRPTQTLRSPLKPATLEARSAASYENSRQDTFLPRTGVSQAQAIASPPATMSNSGTPAHKRQKHQSYGYYDGPDQAVFADELPFDGSVDEAQQPEADVVDRLRQHYFSGNLSPESTPSVSLEDGRAGGGDIVMVDSNDRAWRESETRAGMAGIPPAPTPVALDLNGSKGSPSPAIFARQYGVVTPYTSNIASWFAKEMDTNGDFDARFAQHKGRKDATPRLFAVKDESDVADRMVNDSLDTAGQRCSQSSTPAAARIFRPPMPVLDVTSEDRPTPVRSDLWELYAKSDFQNPTDSERQFDEELYSQLRVADPPAGARIWPGKGAASRDEKREVLFLPGIDPRVHWAHPRSKKWHEAKQAEIEARGTRKANFGKAAQRMAELRRTPGSKRFEDTIPHLHQDIQDDPDWLAAQRWIFECRQKDRAEEERAAAKRTPRKGKLGRRRKVFA
jgi:hypothetical protein